MARYRKIWSEVQGGSALPKMGMVRFIVVAETDDKAIAIARRAYLRWRASFTYLSELNGTLPQISWVVTNQRYSEHPDGAPTDGAYYVGKVLQALNADPRVFNSTLVIVNYDENDGQFDHVPPRFLEPVSVSADLALLNRQLVDLGGEDEIVFAQAADGVRP